MGSDGGRPVDRFGCRDGLMLRLIQQLLLRVPGRDKWMAWLSVGLGMGGVIGLLVGGCS